MNGEVIEAIRALAREKGIAKEVLFDAIEEALKSAYRRNFKRNSASAQNVRVSIDRDNGSVTVYARKIVVDAVMDDSQEIGVEEARAIQAGYEPGDIVEIEVTPRDFGRVAAQTAKQVIVQRIREAERGNEYQNLSEKENEVLTAIIERQEGRMIQVAIGQTEGMLEPTQQIPGEVYKVGMHMKVYVLDISKTPKGPVVRVSRTHPWLVKRLFEMEVPEIQSGVVQIKSIAREPGSRTKIAVHATDAAVDPVGSCVGPRGIRVENIVTELNSEKIDIIKWSSDPAEFIANALNPARALNVFISESEKACRVVVPDSQLSLAIGKEGQNARLAARLSGWRIDIKSQSQAESLMSGDPPADVSEDSEEDQANELAAAYAAAGIYGAIKP
ncbi:MAG: transcription termination factor NusA [Oscillospiraceae bacterium]|jgi:N utilization substance protein A|nr:transcription termination factor NusA [Oscillospiraceae bacterium]